MGLPYDKKKQTKVAIKRMKGAWGDEGIPTHCYREVATMRYLKHDYIVGISEIFMSEDPPMLSFMMERHPTNLHDLIQKSTPLPLRTIRKYLKQLLQAT